MSDPQPEKPVDKNNDGSVEFAVKIHSNGTFEFVFASAGEPKIKPDDVAHTLNNLTNCKYNEVILKALQEYAKNNNQTGYVNTITQGWVELVNKANMVSSLRPLRIFKKFAEGRIGV